ncbi:DUF6518 family protein [Naasia sp. SYSU D00057]|uniref:DUF6518 family protein n=1 Tax=Naasia sp. SYSU D00057 TaxID=2817380 RepID=UPI001B30F3CE|nr:DUF6518 family protein [Naasia sp. SYSU D00057]
MTALPVPRASIRLALRSALIVLMLGAAVGGLTSLGQLAGLGPLANSASAWTIPTAAAVLLVRADLRVAPIFGTLGFAADILGYTVVSNLRAHPFDPSFWLVVGLVAGPVVGVAAALLRQADRRRVAVGIGVLAGILVGEGVYGLTTVAATTGPSGWIVLMALAVAAFAAVALRRLRSAAPLAFAAAVTVAVAAAFLVGYGVVLPAVLLA